MTLGAAAAPPRRVPGFVRFVAFVLSAVVAAVVLGRLTALMVQLGWIRGTASDFAQQLIFSLVACAALLFAHLVCVRMLEHAPWSVVYMDRHAARPSVLGVGALLGALTIAIPTLVFLGVRWFRVEPRADGSWLGDAVALLVVLAPAALWEELAFRGYLFTLLRRWLGPAVAIAATSVPFGIIHLTNPNADARSAFLVTLAGVFLGGIMLATRSLWAVWIAHLAWNWMMAAVLHTPVSGVSFAMPDYQMVETGPDWATGGDWGPEGGAGAAASMLAALYLLVRRAPGWWRRRDERDVETQSPAADAARTGVSA